MPTDAPDPLAAALDRALDALLAGDLGDPELEARDPALAATLRRLVAHDPAPPPDPAFAARLWTDLHAAPPAPTPALPPRAIPVASATTARGRRRKLLPWDDRGLLAMAATAALLLATLGLGARLLVLRGEGNQAARFLPAPALLAPPSASATPTDLQWTTTSTQTPRAVTWAGAVRMRLDPGASATEPNDGPVLIVLEHGTLTLHNDRLLQVVRAGSAASPTTVPAGAPLTLQPGDAAIMPNGGAKQLTNVGPDQALAIAAELGTAEAPGPAASDVLFTYQGDVMDALTPPVTLLLRRTTLGPHATLAPPPGASDVVALNADPNGSVGVALNGTVTNWDGTPQTIYVVAVLPSRFGTPIARATPTG